MKNSIPITVIKLKNNASFHDECKTNVDDTSHSFIIEGSCVDLYKIDKNDINCEISHRKCYDNKGVIISIINKKPIKYIITPDKNRILFKFI